MDLGEVHLITVVYFCVVLLEDPYSEWLENEKSTIIHLDLKVKRDRGGCRVNCARLSIDLRRSRAVNTI